MKTLLCYEIKKILMKKSTIVAFVLLFAVQIFLGIAGSLGSTYVEDVFVETHAERNKIDRENGIALSGRTIDEELLTEMSEAYAKIDMEDRQYLLSEVYQKEVRKYAGVLERFKIWGIGNSFLSGNITTEQLYKLRDENRDAMWESYELSETEQEYWMQKDEEVEIPFTYEYATAYEGLIGMSGGYMTCLILTFFISISMVNVFAEEHSRKTDQLILCSRYGRGKLYVAKILAGSIMVFTVNALFILVSVGGDFFSFGTEGFDARLQSVMLNWYSYDLSVGEVLLIMLGLLLLSSVMTAIFTMVLTEVLRNSIGVMAILIGGLFAARIVVIPASWEVVSRMWNYIPINLLKIDQGFTDLRLVSIFGMKLTTWQFAPILYTLIIALLILIGSRCYKNYQVSGR